MINSFTFNGKNSYSDFGLRIAQKDIYSAPERDLEIVEVPGRDGEVIIDNGRFKNIEVKYTVILHDIKKDSRLIKAWLSTPGYFELSDTFQPDVIRYAYLNSRLDIRELLEEHGTCEIVFSAMPYLYYTDGLDFKQTYPYNQNVIDINDAVVNEHLSEITIDYEHLSGISTYPTHQWRCDGYGRIGVGGNTIEITQASETESIRIFYFNAHDKTAYCKVLDSSSGSLKIRTKYVDVSTINDDLAMVNQSGTFATIKVPKNLTPETLTITQYSMQANWRTL